MKKLISSITKRRTFTDTPQKDAGLRLSQVSAGQEAEQCFEATLDFYGDDLKAMVQRLRTFKMNKEKFSMADAKLPNYLWVSPKHDFHISNCISAFAGLLHNEKIIQFTGILKYFEYKLPYVAPNDCFSELARLNNVISQIAGHHRYFKGIAFIDISEWLKYSNDAHFNDFLAYMSNKEILSIFYANSDNNSDIENIKSTLSVYMLIDSISLKFPSADKLLVFVGKYLKQKGFCLKEDAKALIMPSIQEIVSSKNFRGMTTIKHYADSLTFDLLSSNECSHEISAKMITDFNCGSGYVQRMQKIGRQVIGFNTSK